MNHLEVYQIERYVPKDERNWMNWAATVERMLGHSLDGDQAKDGYCLGYAYDWFKLGSKPQEYVESVKATKMRIASEKPLNGLHTKGPWKVYGTQVSNENATQCICFLPEDHEDTQANARLIAKSPELLAALKAIVMAEDIDLYIGDEFEIAKKLLKDLEVLP